MSDYPPPELSDPALRAHLEAKDATIARLERELAEWKNIGKVQDSKAHDFLEQRDAWKERAEAAWARAQRGTDHVVHYRNLAIKLGAKPDDMLDAWDRKLCEEGIDTDLIDDNGELWRDLEKAEKERDELRAEVARQVEYVAAAVEDYSDALEREKALRAALGRISTELVGDRCRAIAKAALSTKEKP